MCVCHGLRCGLRGFWGWWTESATFGTHVNGKAIDTRIIPQPPKNLEMFAVWFLEYNRFFNSYISYISYACRKKNVCSSALSSIETLMVATCGTRETWAPAAGGRSVLPPNSRKGLKVNSKVRSRLGREYQDSVDPATLSPLPSPFLTASDAANSGRRPSRLFFPRCAFPSVSLQT